MNTMNNRYHRQMSMDGWGAETQERLAAGRVFVAGMGGLGCPVAMNLVLAGVGHIRICDSDTVEITNLNRQFLYAQTSLGKPKASSALESLASMNPHVEIVPVQGEINRGNVDELVADVDIIVDCLDNFPARHVLSQCAVRKGIPLVHGAVWGMEGRICVFHPPETPCLECIFPHAPESEETPVLGGVTSAVGSMQAIETIRFLAGERPALMGTMLVMDFPSMSFQRLELSHNPSCPVCGGGSVSPPGQ